MNSYLLVCVECDDEVTLTCSSDVPSFCPFCGGEDIEVSKREEPLEWEDDE